MRIHRRTNWRQLLRLHPSSSERSLNVSPGERKNTIHRFLATFNITRHVCVAPFRGQTEVSQSKGGDILS